SMYMSVFSAAVLWFRSDFLLSNLLSSTPEVFRPLALNTAITAVPPMEIDEEPHPVDANALPPHTRYRSAESDAQVLSVSGREHGDELTFDSGVHTSSARDLVRQLPKRAAEGLRSLRGFGGQLVPARVKGRDEVEELLVSSGYPIGQERHQVTVHVGCESGIRV